MPPELSAEQCRVRCRRNEDGSAANPVQPRSSRKREEDERQHLGRRSNAIWKGLAFRTTVAMKGIRDQLIWLPMRLTVDAVQSFM